MRRVEHLDRRAPRIAVWPRGEPDLRRPGKRPHRRPLHKQDRRQTARFGGEFRRFAGIVGFRALLRPVQDEASQRNLATAVVDEFQLVRSVGETFRHGDHRRLRALGSRGGVGLGPGKADRRKRTSVQPHGEAPEPRERVGVRHVPPRDARPRARRHRHRSSLEPQRRGFAGRARHPVAARFLSRALYLRVPVPLHFHLRMAG